MIEVYQTPTFKKKYKKLEKNVQKFVKDVIKKIIDDPSIGTEKAGDLSGFFVFKFKIKNMEYLLAYQYDEESRILHAVGVHENFYRDLKRKNK